MNDSMFSRHAGLNAGVVPATAEELSQRYVKLFQQYSRLKAQHAVLKKAVIQEQTSNSTLQGSVKEKEKELRKLQEQLDLLAFHNERLTKRIQAVQDSDQSKGSHFSLLGGSMKKELEKNTQALDEAKMDLERKIEENEKLHEELNERQFEFTQSINDLLKQIQNLEERIHELQQENMNLQQAKLSAETVDVKDEDGRKEESVKNDKLEREVEALKKELDLKTKLLEKRDASTEKEYAMLTSEIQSLRAILLAKVGKTHLYEHVPESSTALKDLEEQATAYFQPESSSDLPSLPSEIAEKLALSSDTFRTEMNNLLNQLKDVRMELESVKKEKEQFLTKEKDLEAKIQQQNEKIEDLLQRIEADQKGHEIAIIELQTKIEELENSNSQLRAEAQEQRSIADTSRRELDVLKHENKPTKSLEEEVQPSISIEPIKQENSGTKGEIPDDDSEVFVYPAPTVDAQSHSETFPAETVKKDAVREEEEEEEEVFVYRGMDAPHEHKDTPEPSDAAQTVDVCDTKNEEHDNNQQEAIDGDSVKLYSEEDVVIREERLKSYYEQKLNALTEKIQMTDSKALRFAAMYKSLKERLVSEGREKDMMMSEIERLNKEVKKVQDLLSTTETGYQTQIQTMTEFITSLQQTVEDLSRSQPLPQPTQARKYNNDINNVNHLHSNNLS